jgi:hypothetical protein
MLIEIARKKLDDEVLSHILAGDPGPYPFPGICADCKLCGTCGNDNNFLADKTA